MSTNCIKCILAPRTALDLLCDNCRQKDKEEGIYPFPIQGGTYRDEDGKYKRPIKEYPQTTVPWWIAQEAYKYYASKFGTGQSMERLAERGGFGRDELLMLLRKEI